MKEVELLILAEDIRNTDYCNSSNCAITRAIKRAGINGVHVGSMLVQDLSTNKQIGYIPLGISTKVIQMYEGAGRMGDPGDIIALEPVDFTTILTITDRETIYKLSK